MFPVRCHQATLWYRKKLDFWAPDDGSGCACSLTNLVVDRYRTGRIRRSRIEPLAQKAIKE